MTMQTKQTAWGKMAALNAITRKQREPIEFLYKIQHTTHFWIHPNVVRVSSLCDSYSIANQARFLVYNAQNTTLTFRTQSVKLLELQLHKYTTHWLFGCALTLYFKRWRCCWTDAQLNKCANHFVCLFNFHIIITF